MEQLRELLESCINEELINAVLSNPKDKEGIQKVKVRPVLMKGDRKSTRLNSSHT